MSRATGAGLDTRSVLPSSPVGAPRLGFLGVGWIGRHRLEAIIESGLAEVVGVADPVGDAAARALTRAPGAEGVGSLEELLELDLDGLVIATPSALHAEQASAALEAGVPVFCQKPLGRTEAEVREVIGIARSGDLLLGVDLSYRHTTGIRMIRDLIRSGGLGEVYAADLVFHNAYGPDKPWFYDPRYSGGGCMIDLGIHLIDLALWILEGARVVGVRSRLFAGGEPLRGGERVEDYGVAELELEGGVVVRVATSWGLHAGRDAVIGASFHGTRGGASFRNVGGSFYDFVAESYSGTSSEVLTSPPDLWGGRAAVSWAEELAGGAGFDREIESLIDLAWTLDQIYGR